MMGGGEKKKNQLSGAQKKKKKKKKKEKLAAEMGAFEAWTDEVVDGIGDASQGCFCIARASEIE